MDANVKKGTHIHEMHFKSMLENHIPVQGVELYLVDEFVKENDVPLKLGCGKRIKPDWVLVNGNEKKVYVIDITSKYNRQHFRKGLSYLRGISSLKRFNEPGWEFIYMEDYWLTNTSISIRLFKP